MSVPAFLGQRPLVSFALYLALCGAIAATLAWPLWALTGLPFDRVLSRTALLAAALLLVPLLKFVGLRWRALPLRPLSWPQFARFWLLGIGLICVPGVIFFLTGFRVLDPRLEPALLPALQVVGLALLSGALVGLFEEVLFRGALLSLWLRSAPRFAVLGTSLVYAAVHFIEAPKPAAEPTWASGWQQLLSAFTPLTSPAAYWDSFLALALLGAGLAWVRLRTGSLWPAIALHAAFVTFLKLYKALTVREMHVDLAWFAGSYDNFVGLLTAAWLLLVFAAVRLFAPQRT